jgi:hypothetical protein
MQSRSTTVQYRNAMGGENFSRARMDVPLAATKMSRYDAA